MPGDHHPLAFEGAVDQLRQLVLGLCNAMGAHKSNIAIGWPFCPARKVRAFGGTRRAQAEVGRNVASLASFTQFVFYLGFFGRWRLRSRTLSPGYADAREPVMAWYRLVRDADWVTPADLKRAIRSASILKDGRAVFNIAGNKYRIVVWINYRYRVVYIRFHWYAPPV